jgi:hypothetical protein
VAGIGGCDALAGVDLRGDGVGCRVGEGGHLFIVCGRFAPEPRPIRPSA